MKDHVDNVKKREDEVVLQLDCINEALKSFQVAGISKDSQMKGIKKLFDEWTAIMKLAKETKKEITPIIGNESDKTAIMIRKLEDELKDFTTGLKKRQFYKYDTGVQGAKSKLVEINSEIAVFDQRIEDHGYCMTKFGNSDLINNSVRSVEFIRQEVDNMVSLWEHIEVSQTAFKGYMDAKWVDTNPGDMEEEVKKLLKQLKDMKVDRKCGSYVGLLDDIKRWLVFLPLITELRDPGMRDRHWNAIKQKVGKDFSVDDKLTLADVFNLNLNKHQEDVEEITDQARQEARMEKMLEKIEEVWSDINFDLTKHKDTDIMMLKMNEETFEMLEENQVNVTAMTSSRYLATFEEKVIYWQKSLAAIAEIVQIISQI